MNRIFGWDLPPGCTNADIERVYGGDLPPFCEDCEIDPCDDPENCEKYKETLKQEEEDNKEEVKYYEEMFKTEEGG